MIINKPKLGARYRKLKSALIEAQNHRCATCTKEIVLCNFDGEPNHASIVKIDRSAHHNYYNSVLICEPCAGVQGNHETLLDYYEFLQLPKMIKITKPKKIYPETMDSINAKLYEFCIQNDAPIYRVNDNSSYKFAPPERIDYIVDALCKHILAEKKNKVTRHRRHGFFRLKNKKKFSEAQNHKCCYCGIGLTDHISSQSSRVPHNYPTFEHVITLSEGGEDGPNNLVIACWLCNNLREQTGLSAEDYYEWIVAHPEARDVEKNRLIKNIKQRNIPIFYPGNEKDMCLS